MSNLDVLRMLLDRLAASGGEEACFSVQELAELPTTSVKRLKAVGLLIPSSPADTVICPGCEEDCAMAVETVATPKGTHAFVACDKREDTARVPVPLSCLEQWQCAPRQLADVLAILLNLRRPATDTSATRFDLGVLKGTKHSAHIALNIGRTLHLGIAGHHLELADVMELGDKGLILERRALLRCVDNPVAAAGDKESSEQRRDRLRARAQELQAAGESAFIKVLMAEENLSKTRIQQLLKEEQPTAPSWFDPSTKAKGATPKKPKAQR
ncbi:MAG: hypothetical protein WAO76_05670 [Georgfuchsia sp.]